MRKIILFNLVSVDGFFEGPNRDIEWHSVDEEFNEFAIEQLDSAGGLIFGRVTYELMAGYWPTQGAKESDPQIADRMNALPKIVFSRTLETADWTPTRLVSGNLEQEVTQLKQPPGQDLFIFGSAHLASALIEKGFIDELRIMVSPIILVKGEPLFRDLPERISLRLIGTRIFENGNVLLCYEPAVRA